MTGDYDEWHQALRSAFLLPHNGPTVIFVDDSELARLAPDSDDAAADLAQAVRAQLRLAEGRTLFDPVHSAYEQWNRGLRADPPPVLPVIAITVLAAARMRSDADARSTNYYLRLAQALLPDGAPDEIENLRHALREGGAFLDVVGMWRGLHDWIDAQGGAFGTSTIREHPRLQRIGFPLSQALVRQQDRIALTRFFQALRFAPSSTPNAGQILSALDIWIASPRNRLSDSLMHAVADAEIRPLLGAVVRAHAQAWDGRVLTSDGNLRISMRIGLDIEAWKARWLFRTVNGGPPEATLRGSGPDEVVTLTEQPGWAYYDALEPPPVAGRQVLTGFRMRGDSYTAEFLPSHVVFFSLDPETGGWSSRPGMVPFEEHLVAIESQYVADFKELLRQAAKAEWREIPQRGGPLLAGYRLFENVCFADGERLESALASLPSLRRIDLRPAAIPRPRLVNGLPIATELSTSHYLVGGEPDLLLPSGSEPRMVTVQLDGMTEQIQANGFPLPLRRLVSGAGRHVIDADGFELAFTSIKEYPGPNRADEVEPLGWNRDGQLTRDHENAAVVGALVEDLAQASPVLARRLRDESWLLHADGTTEQCFETARPQSLGGSPAPGYSQYFELSARSSVRWLAQRRGARWSLTEIGPARPRTYELELDVLPTWRRACEDPNTARLWQIQLDMAGGST